jgi:hypothetical protein
MKELLTRDLLTEVRGEFRGMADPAVREALDRFSQPDQRTPSYGIAAPEIKRVARNVYRSVKAWPVADRDRFCEELWKSGMSEEGALVCYVYRRFAKQCGAREFGMFTRWLERYVNNWGLTDGVSLWLLGASIANEPS